VVRAAELAGIAKQTIYTRQWREDTEFQAAYERAKEMSAQVFEDEVVRRAVEGVEKPTGWYKGVAGGTVTEYSDNLLMFKLKQLKPEYRDRLEVRSFNWNNLDMERLPDRIIARLAAGEPIEAVLASEMAEFMKALKPGALVPDGECEELEERPPEAPGDDHGSL